MMEEDEIELSRGSSAVSDDCGIKGCPGEPEWKRSTVVVTLSQEEATYMIDILDWWLDGFEAATNDVIKDPTFEEPEHMLDALDGMVVNHDMAAQLKMRLSRVVKVKGAT